MRHGTSVLMVIIFVLFIVAFSPTLLLIGAVLKILAESFANLQIYSMHSKLFHYSKILNDVTAVVLDNQI